MGSNMGLNKIVVGLWVKSSNFHEFAIKNHMASVCTNTSLSRKCRVEDTSDVWERWGGVKKSGFCRLLNLPPAPDGFLFLFIRRKNEHGYPLRLAWQLWPPALYPLSQS